MKYIILPTDFSDSARNAMVYAIHLFGVKDVQYTLLNTFLEPNLGTGVVVSMIDVLQKRSSEGLAEDVDFLIKEFPEAQLQRRSEHGDLSLVINDLLTEELYDFVVMGTKGETSGRWLMGSVAKSTIQDVNIPVIVVPDEASYRPVKKIVYATDLNKDESYLIGLVVNFARVHDAEITLLHVGEGEINQEWNIDEMEGIKESINYTKVDFRELVHANIEEAIINHVEENDTDILAITTYTTTFMKKLFHRSVTKQLLLHAHLPMLVFNRKEYDKVFL